MSSGYRTTLDFIATERFEIVRHIGSGGMGSVYEAIDCELNARVALKRMNGSGPDQLLRLKREFREFQDLSHPNLVSLRELFSDGSQWFFSMELLDGVDFLEYVRASVEPSPTCPSNDDDDDRTVTADTTNNTGSARMPRRAVRLPGPLDENRLRLGLPQLALGIHALHDVGKLHRDIKPSNVLVTRDGRVVLVDYGVAEAVGDRPRARRLTGTVAYMAPEQGACAQPGRAADWYAFGVVLFEALTGRRPHEGTTQEILRAKQSSDGPSPRDVEPTAPRDLAALCADLLKADPDARPRGPEVLARLGVEATWPHARPRPAECIRRQTHLAALDSAYAQARDRSMLVLVCGESGVGKSGLVRHFVDDVNRRDLGAITLTGSCFERESVPYKAFDGIVDALGAHFESLPVTELQRLLPENMSLIAHAFPVLWKSPTVRAAASTDIDCSLDPRERRQRLFGALRELLQRIAKAAPLVVAIDDLQWADADSCELLAELMAEPHAPRLLLVATVRTDPANNESLERSKLGDLVRNAVLLPVERQ